MERFASQSRSAQPRTVLQTVLAALAFLFAGCESLSLPRIDPTGERIFVPTTQPTLPPTAFPSAGGLPATRPAAIALPTAATAPALPPASVSMGRRRALPSGNPRDYTSGVAVFPCKVVAPVGSEVVMMAAVCGADGRLMANERVEWNLAPGGVGQFIAIGEKTPLDWICGWHTWPKKVSNTYAIGTTSSRYLTLTRGTPATFDDVEVLKGQAWLTITSPIEGVSHVSAYAPSAYAWQARQQTASIYWLDAEFSLPPPASNPVGSTQSLTTTVTRYTSHSPIAGWRVRYEIVDGPDAHFLPDGGRVIEVDTDDLGQATVEIEQVDPRPGTNSIRVEVVRPANAYAGETERLVATTATTTRVWTAPDLSLNIEGPSQATVGGSSSYRMEIRNDSDLTAREVVVTLPLSAGFSYAGADPPAAQTAMGLEWRLGDLQGGEGRTIDLSLQGDRQGVLNACATARSADGRSAQDCVAVTVLVPALELSVTGPPSAQVGDTLSFDISLTNRGNQVEYDLLLVDRFPPELRHAQSDSPIERNLGDLQPGETKVVTLDLEVLSEGRPCNVVEVRRDNRLLATDEHCVAIGVSEGLESALEVAKSVEPRAVVGDQVIFKATITNRSNSDLTNVKIVDHFDAALDPTQAPRGYRLTGNDFTITLRSLPAGKTEYIDVYCTCVKESNACSTISVTTAEGASGEAEACVEISNPPTGLAAAVRQTHNPLRVGNSGRYVVTVTNHADVPATNVAVTVTLPAELTADSDQTQPDARITQAGRRIRFKNVAELAAGEAETLEFWAIGEQPGKATVRVDVASDAEETGPTAEATTTVIQ